MKNGLIFISVLLVMSLAFNVFQYINEKVIIEDREKVTLTSSDSIFIHRTVEIYDSFVRSQIGEDMPIGEAYRELFGDFNAGGRTGSYMMPDSTFVFTWTYDLVAKSEPNDMLEVRYREAHDGLPPGWSMYIGQGFKDLLREVAEHNEFWMEGAGAVTEHEHITSTYIGWVIRGYEQIDFSQKEERFLASIFYMGGCMYHEALRLGIDLQ